MKKLLITGCALLLGFASCTNDFLEEEMVATITQDYFDTPIGTEGLINGTYHTLLWRYNREFGPWLFHAGTDAELAEQDNENQYNVTVYSPAAGDNSKGGQVGYLIGQTDATLGQYMRINNANRAIRNIREGLVDLGDRSNERLSEVLFNRAYAYYMMITQLGDIPMKTEYTAELPNVFHFPKESSENLYKLMISDLRFAYENLRSATQIGTTAERNNRISKGAAAHFLAKLYLQRAQAAGFQNSSETHLKMLYKGNVATDLDSCIYYASRVIDGGDYELAADYADLFETAKGAWPNENNREIVLSASFSPNGRTVNGPFEMRFLAFFVNGYASPTGAAWGLSTSAWAYGFRNRTFSYSDWGYDVFTDKMADSRFEKTFFLEYVPLIPEGAIDVPFYAYTDASNNKTQAWKEDNAAYFNENILPSYDRASWGKRRAVAGEHKIGTDDLGLVFLENSKETALTIAEADAQPYVLYPRWVKSNDGTKYYYRLNGTNNFVIAPQGLDASGSMIPNTRKHNDLNREGVTSPYGSRDVSIFRLAETYLLRAEAYGRKGDYSSAIADINTVRARAAYKPANNEVRAEVIARLYPGAENLPAAERKYPYTVTVDKTGDMLVDASYWDGASAKSAAENYPPTATTDLQRFVHFIYNELTRETIAELELYEGIHHAGIQWERIQYRQQMGSTLSDTHWPVADNIGGTRGQNGRGKGFFQPFHTFRPWPQAYILLLSDENGKLLDDAARKQYQNPGYL